MPSTVTIEAVTIVITPDSDADTSYLEQAEFAERLAEYQADGFYFVGVRLVAELAIPYGKDTIAQTIESPGLWSIESDSGEDYFRSVASDEAETLRDMLSELGITLGDFDAETAPLSYR